MLQKILETLVVYITSAKWSCPFLIIKMGERGLLMMIGGGDKGHPSSANIKMDEELNAE